MSSIQIARHRDDIILLTLDMPGKSANVLTDQVYADLASALDTLESSPPAGVILVSAKPSIYVAGADLVKISQALDWSDEQIFQFCEDGRGIMSRFSRLPSVSVAAVHGVCVGGGMELTLWCDQRVAADERQTRFGLPEVKLGLIPGWAGTVRLPRLIGLPPAVDLVTSGRLVSAAECRELGIVTELVPREQLLDAATSMIDRELASGDWMRQREKLLGPVTGLPADVAVFRATAQTAIDANRDIDPRAPTLVLNHMCDSAAMDAAAACASESRVFATVWGSPENRGLLHAFFLEERARKTRGDYGAAKPPVLKTIGVIGAGLMGCQIARLALAAGYQIRMFDADQEKLQRNVAELAVVAKNGDNLQIADSIESFRTCDLVIESIVEKLKIKQQLFERLCAVVSHDTWLATNTSTIPVADIATAVINPARLVGLHFCLPVEPLRLVEIIASRQSSEFVVAVAVDLVRAMRKTPVVVTDQPGFVVNRLLCPMLNRALDLLQNNIRVPEIDEPMREFGFAVGPLEMIDFIGVDTIMYAGETFLRTMPGLISLNPVLPVLVKRGRLGRKTGAGFYRYGSFDSPRQADPEFESIMGNYQKQPWQPGAGEILNQLLDPMIAAGRGVLNDGVVPDARDVDLCSILGTTFPAARGGILYWADHLRQPVAVTGPTIPPPSKSRISCAAAHHDHGFTGQVHAGQPVLGVFHPPVVHITTSLDDGAPRHPCWWPIRSGPERQPAAGRRFPAGWLQSRCWEHR